MLSRVFLYSIRDKKDQTNRFLYIKVGITIIFIDFPRFSIHEDVAPLGVMIRLRAADESSLSDDAVKLIIKTAIRQAHLHESIFRPFQKKILFW